MAIVANDPSSIHISDLKAQQNLAFCNSDSAISGHRPYSERYSPIFGYYQDE
jgi:hypothetical protein